MKKNNFLKISLLSLSLVLLAVAPVGAQTAAPQAFITWKAKSYAPASFGGKILPGSTSPVLADVEVIDKGKPANLSQVTIYWYLGDNLINRGIGLQSVTFRAPQTLSAGSVSLRVRIPEYPGGIVKSVNIPVVRPSVVLESLYPGGTFNSQSVQVRALPYFFTVPDISFLSFNWSVNGSAVQTAENPQNLRVNINQGAAPGSVLDIKVGVSNPVGYYEGASDTKSLTFSL